jgi:hypothetical protein
MRTSAVIAGILAAALAPAGTALADPPASSAPVHRIAPGQFFAGQVNGGRIVLVCPGPFHAGETGHPVAGQSVSVRQLFPPTPTGLGFTGNASTIAATLFVISPSAGSATAPIPLAVFAAYDRPVPIPTTLSLPCGGAGAVGFDPVQGGPDARTSTVRVKFPFLSAASG